jgi:hypothetical protein
MKAFIFAGVSREFMFLLNKKKEYKQQSTNNNSKHLNYEKDLFINSYLDLDG